MGKTLVIYRVTPKDMEKIDETIAEIKGLKSGKVADVKKEPIGFGVTILKVGVIIPEKDDAAMENATKELSSMKTIEESEQQEMTLL